MAKKTKKKPAEEGPRRIVFSDPKVPGVYNWTEVRQQLMAAPNEWHLVFEQDRTSLVVSIRAGHVNVLTPVEKYQIATRNNYHDETGRRMCDLWMRYLTQASQVRQLPRSRRRA